MSPAKVKMISASDPDKVIERTVDDGFRGQMRIPLEHSEGSVTNGTVVGVNVEVDLDGSGASVEYGGREISVSGRRPHNTGVFYLGQDNDEFAVDVKLTPRSTERT